MGHGGAKKTEPMSDSKNSPPTILPAPSELERVQRKWQMASCAHFFETFGNILPLRQISVDTAEDLTPSLLERAIAEPDLDTAACIALRDAIMALLISIGCSSQKSSTTTWFASLRMLIDTRKSEFTDCYVDQKNVLHDFDNGMDFLVSVAWNVRLGMLLTLCDIAVEESPLIRDAIREAEQASSMTKSAIDERCYRLTPMGRCSQRRFHYKVGKTRIYSGYKRKGSGALVVECSDSDTMQQFADALASSPHVRDQKLAQQIKEQYLAPLLELEERGRRKLERKRLAEIQKEECRRRNASRPRRAKASYL